MANFACAIIFSVAFGLAVLAIGGEIRRALEPNSAVRQLLHMIRHD